MHTPNECTINLPDYTSVVIRMSRALPSPGPDRSPVGTQKAPGWLFGAQSTGTRVLSDAIPARAPLPPVTLREKARPKLGERFNIARCSSSGALGEETSMATMHRAVSGDLARSPPPDDAYARLSEAAQLRQARNAGRHRGPSAQLAPAPRERYPPSACR